MLLARHPVSTAIVVAVVAAVATVFLFFRPEYHSPNEDSLVELDLSKYPPAADGWTWPDGQPGFRFGDEEEKWNPSEVRRPELASARAAAQRSGVAPESVRVVAAMRLGPGDLTMIVAGQNAAGETCLGFVRPRHPLSVYCPSRLGPQAAFIMFAARGPLTIEGRTTHPSFLLGVARSDVTRVVVDQRPDWRNAVVYDRERGSPWGTFELSLGDSRDVSVRVYGERGLLATVPIDLTEPGDVVIPVSD